MAKRSSKPKATKAKAAPEKGKADAAAGAPEKATEAAPAAAPVGTQKQPAQPVRIAADDPPSGDQGAADAAGIPSGVDAAAADALTSALTEGSAPLGQTHAETHGGLAQALQRKSEPEEASGYNAIVVGPREGFRRCGRRFGQEPTVIPLEELSEGDLKRLRDEPNLLVNIERAIALQA